MVVIIKLFTPMNTVDKNAYQSLQKIGNKIIKEIWPRIWVFLSTFGGLALAFWGVTEAYIFTGNNLREFLDSHGKILFFGLPLIIASLRIVASSRHSAHDQSISKEIVIVDTLIIMAAALISLLIFPRPLRHIVSLIFIGSLAVIWLPSAIGDTIKRVFIAAIISLSLFGLYVVDSREHKKQIDELYTRINQKDKEIENLIAQRDTIENSMQIIRQLRTQSDSLHTQSDSLRAQSDSLRTQRDRLRTQSDSLRTQRDKLRVQRDSLCIQRDSLLVQKNSLRAQRDILLARTIFFTRHQESLGPDSQIIDQIQVTIKTSDIENADANDITVSLIIEKLSFNISGRESDYFNRGNRYSFCFELPERVTMTLGDLRRSFIVLSHDCKERDWHISELGIKLRFKGTDETNFKKYRDWEEEDLSWLGTRENDKICPAVLILQPRREPRALTQIPLTSSAIAPKK